MDIAEAGTDGPSSGRNSVEDEEEEKPRTIFVGNIPKQVTKRELENVFGDVGPLKRCFMQYPRNDGKFRVDESTVAYVTYAFSEDAVKALETLQSYKFGTNKIALKFTKSRTEQYREPRFPRFRNEEFEQRFQQPPIQKEKKPREKRPKKKSRLIVRNLAFQATEDSLREHFASFGDITDVNILKKPNGKLVGCAFIQYKTVPQAAKALKELNLKPFLGRPVAIDWALPKEKFQEENTEDATIKEEPELELDPDIKIKIEPIDDTENNYDYVEQSKHVKPEESEGKKAPKRRKHSDEESNSDSDYDTDNSEENSKKRKLNFKDADEGKTLFLKNLDFEVTAEELKTFFESYGPLNYAVICKDKLTEHPKGTAFVMFKVADDANKCMAEFYKDPNQFVSHRRPFIVTVAMSKEKLESKMKEDVKKEPKDKRNLYLAREGFIRPGTNSAIGVSAADMNKRTAVQRVKRQMLKNLNVFVSDVRLCVHNLPPALTDQKLRKIFHSNAGPGAKIIEARIMRHLQDIDLTTGIGKSKEYGFVTFTTHEHALKALRSVNNNPKIFTPARRPIVEFSLENRAAIKAKEKRMEKSKEKNLKQQQKQIETKSQVAQNDDSSDEENKPKKKKGKKKKDKKVKAQAQDGIKTEINSRNASQQEEQLPSYSGLKAKVGISTLPSLKPKGKITRKSLKPAKFKKKAKLQARKTREPKMKPKIKHSVDKVDKLVSRYQQKAFQPEKVTFNKKKGKKWYE